MIQPKARPILMSGAMIRANHAGIKTQTRRIMKHKKNTFLDWGFSHLYGLPDGILKVAMKIPGMTYSFSCPYGKPGDLLWVRETWAICSRATDLAKVYYRAHERASHTEFHKLIPVDKIGNAQPTWPKWKPSIFMPRWASRTTLQIISVRVERLSDISKQDAIAEGIKDINPLVDRHTFPEIHEYAKIWESINGAGSWAINPWVWVIEYKVYHQNVDDVLKAMAA